MVVASPRRDAVDEALFFADRLRESSGRVEALVVNRMFPSFGPVPAALPAAPAVTSARGSVARRWPPTWPTWTGSPAGSSNTSPSWPSASPAYAVIRVPFLADDVHDVAGLTEVGRWLFAIGRVRRLSRYTTV